MMFPKFTDAIIYNYPGAESCEIDEKDFLMDEDELEMALNGKEKMEELQFRTIDRMMTYMLNNSLLADNPKMHIKYNMVNLDDDKDSNENETMEQKLLRANQNMAMTDEEILKKYKVAMATDHENRISDEGTFIISMLQAKLDASKVENFYNLNRLSDQVEQMQSLERLKNYQIL